MQYRILGKTNLKISEISLGTEHLNEQLKDVVKDVIHKAVDAGINYFDILFCFEEYLNNIREAIKEVRSKINLAVHIRAGEQSGQYKKFSNVEKCKETFSKVMERLEVNYVDIAIIQFVDNEKEYEEVIAPGGVLEYALQLKAEGKARFVGMSTHSYSAAIKAAKTDKIDVIMVWVNFTNHANIDREKMLLTCAEHAGIIAMKPFAGGNLFLKHEKEIHEEGKGLARDLKRKITPTKCHSYVLAQPGVTTSLFGVRNVDELEESLRFVGASVEERDYAEVVKDFKDYREGECVYCNHCLPCSVGIDIGKTTRILTIAQKGKKEEAEKAYHKLTIKAYEYNECGECMERCPFGVDIIENMKTVGGLFEKK